MVDDIARRIFYCRFLNEIQHRAAWYIDESDNVQSKLELINDRIIVWRSCRIGSNVCCHVKEKNVLLTRRTKKDIVRGKRFANRERIIPNDVAVELRCDHVARAPLATYGRGQLAVKST